MTRDDVIGLLQLSVKQAGSQRALAKKIGVTPAHVGHVLAGKEPGPAILKHLGLRRVVTTTYVKDETK